MPEDTHGSTASRARACTSACRCRLPSAAPGLLHAWRINIPALANRIGRRLRIISFSTFSSIAAVLTAAASDMRNSATGFTYSLGRIANVANAFIIAAVFVYIAGAWIATGVLTLAFGPRTTGQRLEVVSPVALAVAPAADVASASR